MYRSTIYHSNLSDQSAREISVRIMVRLICTILAFLRRIRKMSTLSSANVTDVNLVLKERTHTRLCLNMLIFTHNLGNWLIALSHNITVHCQYISDCEVLLSVVHIVVGVVDPIVVWTVQPQRARLPAGTDPGRECTMPLHITIYTSYYTIQQENMCIDIMPMTYWPETGNSCRISGTRNNPLWE